MPKLIKYLIVAWFLFVSSYICVALSHRGECEALGYTEARIELDYSITCVKTERLELP